MSETREEKEKLLSIAFELLGEKYPQGLYEWLYKYRPEIQRAISGLEDKMNDNFMTGGSVKDLKALLRAYWVVHMKAIKDFSECGKPDCSWDDIRDERIEGLEAAHG